MIICRANDICKESKRQTINAEDVLKAIEAIDFNEFVDPLRDSLDGQLTFRNWIFIFCCNFPAFYFKRRNA